MKINDYGTWYYYFFMPSSKCVTFWARSVRAHAVEQIKIRAKATGCSGYFCDKYVMGKCLRSEGRGARIFSLNTEFEND